MDMKEEALALDAKLVRNQVYNLGKYLGVRQKFNTWALTFLHPSGREVPYTPTTLQQIDIKPADEKIFGQILAAINIWDNQ